MEALIARPLLSAAPAHDAADLHHSLADVIGTQPPFSVHSLCQHFCIETGAWPFPETVSGCLIEDGRNYYIGVNARHSLGRRRFSAAHELYHFLEHRHLLPHVICTDSPEDRDDVVELEADRFAVELLMPRQWVMTCWVWSPVRTDLSTQFGVSRAAMARRLTEIGLVRGNGCWLS